MDDAAWRPLRALRGGSRVSHLFFTDDQMLFAEASEDQKDYSKEGLQSFCKASSKKIHISKSLTFFSPNFFEQDTTRLFIVGIPRTSELGFYFGHLLLYCGRSNQGPNKLLQRFRYRIERWKSKCLPRARQIALEKNFHNRLSILYMLLQKLPSWVHRVMDKAVRQCVHGSSAGRRKIHHLRWDVLGRPKERGGVGLKTAGMMNKALLAKLGWRVISEGGGEWCMVLRSTYGISEEGTVELKPKQRVSSIWKGLVL